MDFLISRWTDIFILPQTPWGKLLTLIMLHKLTGYKLKIRQYAFLIRNFVRILEEHKSGS